MPPTNDPAHRHSKKPAPHVPRKSKPKFEIPAETGVAAPPVAWAYREDDGSTPPPPSPAAHSETKDSSKSNPLLVAGMGLFFAGAATAGAVSLVALGLMAPPLGIANGLLARQA